MYSKQYLICSSVKEHQFTDIVIEQEAWDKEHILSDDIKEWDNPYYGFPQMIRFAFNPNESTRQRMKELKESGISFAFSALLKPKSVKKADDGSHKQFVYEKEILDLLEVIDGSKDDDELLGFLDYDKIKEGNMCRHIVMVLPYCASCDAMEALIATSKNYTISCIRKKFSRIPIIVGAFVISYIMNGTIIAMILLELLLITGPTKFTLQDVP